MSKLIYTEAEPQPELCAGDLEPGTVFTVRGYWPPVIRTKNGYVVTTSWTACLGGHCVVDSEAPVGHILGTLEGRSF